MKPTTRLLIALIAVQIVLLNYYAYTFLQRCTPQVTMVVRSDRIEHHGNSPAIQISSRPASDPQFYAFSWLHAALDGEAKPSAANDAPEGEPQ